MACSIEITGILGITEDFNVAPNRLEVTGLASGCGKILVHVTRQGTGVSTVEIEAIWGEDGATWLAVFDADQGHFTPGTFDCFAYGDKIEIRAVCSDNSECFERTVYDGLPCTAASSCPVVSELTATPGACNPDGTRLVTVSATITPGEVTPVFVHWRHGEDEGAAASFDTPGTFTDTHAYPAGQHSYCVVVTYPEGCGETSATVLVEACPPPATTVVCPSISFGAPVIGACNKATGRDVTLSATLQIEPALTISAELVLLDADGATLATLATGQSANGTLVLTTTTSLAGGVHRVGVHVLSPSECGGADIPVTVEACPTPCPVLSFDPASIDPCDEQGRRHVRVRARMLPTGPGEVSAQLVLWDTVAQVALEELATATSTGAEATLTAELDLVGGFYAFVVRVTSRGDCPGVSQSVTVEDCPAPDDDDDDDDDDNDDNAQFSINWCAVALGTLLAMLVVGALALGIGICVAGVVASGPVAVVFGVIAIIGAVLMMAATIGLLAWLYVCGSCRANCFLLDVLIDVLLMLIAAAFVLTVIGAVIALFGLSTVCWIGWLLDLADFGFLLTLAYWWARVVGCRPWPRWVPEWARWQLPDAWRVTCRRR